MNRFVVGTGRCGSTLLSRMLAESPQVLSLFEFFNGLDMTLRFREEPVSGAELADLLAKEHPFVSMVLRRGYEVPEIVYPFGAAGTRYAREDPLPYLLVAALPRLSDEPDALFDELLAFAAARPRRPLRVHYPEIFAWLCRRLGREVWIERSGSSIDYLGSLDAFFPEARFLHLHRDGREAALSMREHHAFRLAICMTYQVLDSRTRSLGELGELDPGADAGGEDRVGRMLASRPDAEYFGRFWSQQVARGAAAIERLDPSRYLAVRFEDLLAKPADVLQTIAAFFALDPARDGWIARAAALVRGAPPARFPSLLLDEQQRLAAACREGTQLLVRPVGGDVPAKLSKGSVLTQD